jgi:hypothetical protein
MIIVRNGSESREGARPLSPKKEVPPYLSSEAVLRKKNAENIRKRAKIAKKTKR